MKRIFYATVVLLGITVLTCNCTKGPDSIVIRVLNPTDIDREAVPVVIDLAELVGPNHNIQSAEVVSQGESITSQLDDLNGDATADELVFLTDLSGNETKEFQLKLSDTKSQDSSTYIGTYAYIKLNDIKGKHPKVLSVTYPGNSDLLDMYNSIYGHGAVFENEYMAYRIYMDNRQSIDIYGKSTPRLEMDSTGFYTTQEQLEQGYGCDILWAGKSVGVGSFRGYINDQPCYIDTVDWRRQSIIATGPVRSVVEVTDKGWLYKNKKTDMTQRYTIYSHRRDVAVDIHISAAPQNELFCTGVQKLELENRGFINANGLAGSWGNNIPEKNHPEHNEWVGLGLYVNKDNRADFKEDDYNYLALLKTTPQGHIRYHITTCAGREKGGFDDADSWFDYLKTWQAELEAPCKVTIIK